MNWSKAYDIAQYEMRDKRRAAVQHCLAQESRTDHTAPRVHLVRIFSVWSQRLTTPAVTIRRAAMPLLARQSR